MLEKWHAYIRYSIILKHRLFGSQGLLQAESCTEMGSRNCSGMNDSSSESPESLRISPLLCGRAYLSPLLRSTLRPIGACVKITEPNPTIIVIALSELKFNRDCRSKLV